MNSQKNYCPKQEIQTVLERIKKCISTQNYTISLNENRQENLAFIQEYNLRSEKQEQIIKNITVEDFCMVVQNVKSGYEHEMLYIFAPQVDLFNSDGVMEQVDIYTKFNIIDRGRKDYTIVISFHRLNRPIDYPFR